MGALALALASGLCWGTGDFLGGLMTRRLGVLVVMAIAQGAGLLITGALILAIGEPSPETIPISTGTITDSDAVGATMLIGPMARP